jgi:Cu+-exporting ATPase
MPTDSARTGSAIPFSAALLTASASGCASEPKPRPTSIDPANPSAPESQPLAVSALGPSAGLPAAGTTVNPVNEASGAPHSGADHGHTHEGVASSDAKNTSGGGGKAGQQPATIYTCPMHPDVTSDKPGRCPKCGMKLVPKAPGEGKK